MLGRQLELIKLDARKRPLSQYFIFVENVSFLIQRILFYLETLFMIYNVIEMVDSQLIQYGIIWWYRTQKGNPILKISLTKKCNVIVKSRKEVGLWSNIIWLTREHKKEAPDSILFMYMISSKIMRLPYVLPAGCPSCLTTLKGVWVKNTTDCLGWERTLLEWEGF